MKKTSWRIFAGCAGFTIIYAIAAAAAGSVDIVFFNWVRLIADIIGYLGIPISFAVALVITMVDKSPLSDGRRAACIIGGIGLILVYCVYAVILTVVFAFKITNYQEDKLLMDGVIESTKPFGEDQYCEYYTPISIFAKQKIPVNGTIVKKKLEDKYQTVFSTPSKEYREDIGYTFYPLEEPEISFHASFKAYDPAYNDYEAARAVYRMQKAAGRLCPDRKIEPKMREDTYGVWMEGMSIYCRGEADIQNCADDTARMIEEVCRDEFFTERKHSSTVTLKLEGPAGQPVGNIVVSFGYVNGSVYIPDSKSLEKDIMTEYQEAGKRREEEESQSDNQIEKELQEAEKAAAEAAWKSAEQIEGAYIRLYQELYQPEGYPFAFAYNAKGNFYGILSKGKASPGEGLPEMDMNRTVVYDRESKNGKCHTFVEFVIYYEEDGSEYRTVFADFIAVDKQSGTVIRGDKHGWGETGNAAYREATGE